MPTLIASTNITGLQLKEGTAPATPASGYLRIYAASDSTCHILNDGASDIDVSGLATGKIALASQAANDLQYASSATQWARIANGTTGQILTATTAGAPGWAAPAVPTTITVADTTSATCYVGLFESATGNLAPKSDAGLSYNASTGVLYATGFNGPLTGNVTGNCSGTAATVTGATQASITSAANLVTVGTITSGVWNAGAITSSGIIAGTNSEKSYIKVGSGKNVYFREATQVGSTYGGVLIQGATDAAAAWAPLSFGASELEFAISGATKFSIASTGAATFASSISATVVEATSRLQADSGSAAVPSSGSSLVAYMYSGDSKARITSRNWSTATDLPLDINASAVAIGGTLTVNGLGTHAFSATSNSASNILQLTNTGSGTASSAYFQVTSGTTEAYLQAYSQGFANSGMAIASSVRLVTGGAGGLSLAATDGTGGAIRFYTGGTTKTGEFQSGGDFYTNDGTVHSLSDARTKTLQRPFKAGIEALKAVHPTLGVYRYNTDISGVDAPRSSGEFVSITAQSAQSVIPEAVKVGTDGYLTMTTTPLFYATINAVVSHDARIAQLEAEIKALKGLVN